MTIKRSPKSPNQFQGRKKNIKRFGIFFVVTFLVLNILAFAGAYILTHYISEDSWGLGNPRPVNSKTPGDI
jgi:hypothetical protein